MNNLSKSTKDNPFKVPENYFDTFSERVQERIEAEEKPHKTPTLQMLQPYLWMAACVIGFVIVAKVILPGIITPDYKIRQISQVDSQLIETEIPTTLEESDFLFSTTTDASDEEIIDYLSEEDIDTDILIANL
jgi:hypothetical protein